MKEKEFFPSKPKEYPHIYAYRLKLEPDELKVGYTTKDDVRDRINEILGTANLEYDVVYSGVAIDKNGNPFEDFPVHKWLEDHGAIRVERKEIFTKTDRKQRLPEIFRNCTAADIEAAVKSVAEGREYSPSRLNNYKPRQEQREAIDRTIRYFNKQKLENPLAVPKYLWNAKMRFGKTYTSLKMAKELGLNKILIITFKPEVKDSWRTEVFSHVDFENWQFIDAKERDSDKMVNNEYPVVAFISFQDALGKNILGGLKPKNEWIHSQQWDLIIFDEYHYGSWREKAKELFSSGEEEDMELLADNIIPIRAKYMLYLSGTPFRAINTGEFVDDQIYNWTYGMEQEAKNSWNEKDGVNPYRAMPEMILMTYQLPEVCTQIALKGEQNEFDLNEFFRAECPKDDKGKEINEKAQFVHLNEVQRWLDIIRGKADISTEEQKALGAKRPVLPYYDVRLKEIINHTMWYMHSVASCYAMRNLLESDANAFYHDYQVIVAAGDKAGMGAKALGPVRRAMECHKKTITITCAKLTTGVTVRQWSAIFMLSNISTPESYFQSAFRVQNAWTVKSEYDELDKILKPTCYVFDYAPNRALKQLADYACNLDPGIDKSPEQKVAEFIKFLPVLAFDGTTMREIDGNEILDFAASGTTATLLAKKWDSALLVNVSNDIIKAIMDDKEALAAIMKIEGFRKMNSGIFEAIINKSEHIKQQKSRQEAEDGEDARIVKKEITEEEKQVKSLRKQVQENLRKFATRIPLFMYLTDERERCLKDVITKIEPKLFKKVTGITVKDFEKLVQLGVFNSSAMNEAVAAFRRYEESSLTYTGIDKHYGEEVGLWDISVTKEELTSM